MHKDTIVELVGVNGEVFTIAGPDAGDEGVWLGTGVKGLYDPPVKVVYEEPGNYPGARFLNYRILRRDITCAMLVVDDKSDQWAGRDARVRKALAFDKDAFIRVTTPESGRRILRVRLGDAPDVDIETDPHLGSVVVVKLLLVAGDPFWYEDPVIYDATTRKDTRFKPTIFTGGIFDFTKQPQESLQITVDPSDGKGGLNPTDQYIWLKWQAPGSQEKVPNFAWPFPPGVPIPWERAPFTQWVIPDYSFEDPTYANRRLKMPGFIYGEDCRIDTDPRVEQVSSASGSQVWARMNGVRFRNAVPPYTKSHDFNITVSGCAPGQMITLELTRPWSRPWGLE